MKLGAFSLSLSVKNLNTSMSFYEKLGFSQFGGDGKQYAIMKNDNTLIGLFQGMFEGNILTFNPGWDQSANELGDFDDVREIQKTLLNRGIQLDRSVEPETSGPGSIVIVDPDGNANTDRSTCCLTN